MLPKPNRLNLKKDFKWVASGKRVETQFLKLFIKHGDNSFPKIGITASSKTFKNSTDRNRARRLTSQAFQSIYPKLPSSINIVALPKQALLEVKSEDIFKDLEIILTNEKIAN